MLQRTTGGLPPKQTAAARLAALPLSWPSRAEAQPPYLPAQLVSHAAWYARGSALTRMLSLLLSGRTKTFATTASPGGIRFSGSFLGAHCFWAAIIGGEACRNDRDWIGARAMTCDGVHQSQTGLLQVVEHQSKDTIQLLPHRPWALLSLYLTGGAVCSRGIFFGPLLKICLSVWSHVNVQKCGFACVKVSLH